MKFSPPPQKKNTGVDIKIFIKWIINLIKLLLIFSLPTILTILAVKGKYIVKDTRKVKKLQNDWK